METQRYSHLYTLGRIRWRPKGLSRWKGIETHRLHHLKGDYPDLSPKGLSRWKGIETSSERNYLDHLRCPKGLSRLKGIETPCRLPTTEEFFPRLRPKGLSRWKGMETVFDLRNTKTSKFVRKDFPVGREWKLSSVGVISFLRYPFVRKDFPV